jgi:hypothetical protein
MEKEFIPYEQALALKELGFDEPCFKVYDNMGFLQEESVMNTCEIECDCILERCLAPLYQQAFRWFREKYQIDSWMYPNLNGLYSVSNIRRGVGLGKVSEYQTYEEAELECLKKLIEIVKEEKFR